MRATVIHAPQDIRVQEVPGPTVQQPTDVVLRVLRACICGSDLWAYRGESARQPGRRIGHEFLGIVEEAGYRAMGERTALRMLVQP
jgi:threonine dehydrogenase-like Zn-dependent dehydrogenase